MNPNQAKSINSIWLYAFPGSEDYIAKLITNNEGIGLYEKSTGKLCSWIMINAFGALGILQTVEEHKRKKLASELIKDLAKRRAVIGLDSICNISQNNPVSMSVFRNLGFQKIYNIRWVQFKRNKNIRSHL